MLPKPSSKKIKKPGRKKEMMYLKTGFVANSLRELKTGIQAMCCECKRSLLRTPLSLRGMDYVASFPSNVRRERDVKYS